MTDNTSTAPAPEGLVKSMIAQALREGRRVRLRFRGLSMSPLLMPGDEITVEPVRALPRRGQVVLYMACSEFVAHRVVGLFRGPQTLVRLKGDAVRSGFEDIPAGTLLGIVAMRHRAGRTLDFSSPAFRAASTAIAAFSPFAAAALSGMPRPVRRLVRRAFELVTGLL